MKVNKLPKSFYLRDDVVRISKELLGKVLCTNINGQYTTGVISETEAYHGAIDKASHAYNNRRTNRTEVIFGEGGVSYVYLCYGIHYLFNVVTSFKETPHAVLVRAIMPLEGIDIMMQRRGKAKVDPKFTIGPGTVTKALGITKKQDGVSLSGNEIWIEDRNIKVKTSEIITGPRVGVDYAEDHAAWPYRFIIPHEKIKL